MSHPEHSTKFLVEKMNEVVKNWPSTDDEIITRKNEYYNLKTKLLEWRIYNSDFLFKNGLQNNISEESINEDIKIYKDRLIELKTFYKNPQKIIDDVERFHEILYDINRIIVSIRLAQMVVIENMPAETIQEVIDVEFESKKFEETLPNTQEELTQKLEYLKSLHDTRMAIIEPYMKPKPQAPVDFIGQVSTYPGNTND